MAPISAINHLTHAVAEKIARLQIQSVTTGP
jgi:hypothetical protein